MSSFSAEKSLCYGSMILLHSLMRKFDEQDLMVLSSTWSGQVQNEVGKRLCPREVLE